MGELRVDPEHAGRSDGPLILKIPIHQGSQVEAAKVPDCVKDVVHGASDRVVGAQDCNAKSQKSIKSLQWGSGYLLSKNPCAMVPLSCAFAD